MRYALYFRPFLAALYYIRTTPAIAGQYFCAASLISYAHLITAAHCIQPKHKKVKRQPANILAVVGQAYLTEQLNYTESAYGITEIAVHPNWNSSETKYTADIAILTTKFRYFPMYHRLKLICITKSEEINEFESGTVAGWGDGEAGAPYEGAMRTVAIKALSLEDCIINDNKFARFSSRNTFCAGGEGEAPCAGASGKNYLKKENYFYTITLNSGGGFYVEMEGMWFLSGIVSSGPRTMDGSCNVNRYNLYTRVTDYVDWILEVTGQMDSGSIQAPHRKVTC